jgi:predicted SAM-dependent methyltransferase
MTTKAKKAKEELVKYDLGCGNNKREGFTGIDIVSTDAADIVFDLFKSKWTFAKDNSVDEIHCSHFIEHVPDLMVFMNECHRILKPGAQMTVIAPYYSSVRCWQDPTHKNAISEYSFMYYDKDWRELNQLQHYPITADFNFTCHYILDSAWAVRDDNAKTFAIKHYINVVTDIWVCLTKK